METSTSDKSQQSSPDSSLSSEASKVTSAPSEEHHQGLDSKESVPEASFTKMSLEDGDTLRQDQRKISLEGRVPATEVWQTGEVPSQETNAGLSSSSGFSPPTSPPSSGGLNRKQRRSQQKRDAEVQRIQEMERQSREAVLKKSEARHHFQGKPFEPRDVHEANAHRMRMQEQDGYERLRQQIIAIQECRAADDQSIQVALLAQDNVNLPTSGESYPLPSLDLEGPALEFELAKMQSDIGTLEEMRKATHSDDTAVALINEAIHYRLMWIQEAMDRRAQRQELVNQITPIDTMTEGSGWAQLPRDHRQQRAHTVSGPLSTSTSISTSVEAQLGSDPSLDLYSESSYHDSRESRRAVNGSFNSQMTASSSLGSPRRVRAGSLPSDVSAKPSANVTRSSSFDIDQYNAEMAKASTEPQVIDLSYHVRQQSHPQNPHSCAVESDDAEVKPAELVDTEDTRLPAKDHGVESDRAETLNDNLFSVNQLKEAMSYLRAQSVDFDPRGDADLPTNAIPCSADQVESGEDEEVESDEDSAVAAQFKAQVLSAARNAIVSKASGSTTAKVGQAEHKQHEDDDDEWSEDEGYRAGEDSSSADEEISSLAVSQYHRWSGNDAKMARSMQQVDDYEEASDGDGEALSASATASASHASDEEIPATTAKASKSSSTYKLPPNLQALKARLAAQGIGSNSYSSVDKRGVGDSYADLTWGDGSQTGNSFPRSGERKPQANGKPRVIIPSNKPTKKDTSNDGVVVEEAPIRRFGGSEHSKIPRPKIAKSLHSRQYGVRVPNQRNLKSLGIKNGYKGSAYGVRVTNVEVDPMTTDFGTDQQAHFGTFEDINGVSGFFAAIPLAGEPRPESPFAESRDRFEELLSDPDEEEDEERVDTVIEEVANLSD